VVQRDVVLDPVHHRLHLQSVETRPCSQSVQVSIFSQYIQP
jgi:hypothetical protein